MDVLGQPVRPIFFNCLTLEDATGKMSQNVGKQMPTYAA
jgi:hypothetical protein